MIALLFIILPVILSFTVFTLVATWYVVILAMGKHKLPKFTEETIEQTRNIAEIR